MPASLVGIRIGSEGQVEVIYTGDILTERWELWLRVKG